MCDSEGNALFAYRHPASFIPQQLVMYDWHSDHTDAVFEVQDEFDLHLGDDSPLGAPEVGQGFAFHTVVCPLPGNAAEEFSLLVEAQIVYSWGMLHPAMVRSFCFCVEKDNRNVLIFQ
jgi:hypothetical protein